MDNVVAVLASKPLFRRVTLFTTLAVAALIVLSNIAGYVALRATLVHASQSIALSIAQDVVPGVAADVRRDQMLTADVGQAAGVLVEALGPGGVVAKVPGATQELVLEPGDRAVVSGSKPVRRTGVDAAGTPYVVVAVPVADTGWSLVVARPFGPVEGILAVQRVILLGVCAVSVLAAAVVAAFVARASLRPVHELTEAVRHVTDTGDLQPVSVRYATGDLSVLAAGFNLMLKSLTRARERQSRLVADAGHELRTPLTSLRTNVDLLVDDRKREKLTEPQKGEIFGDVQAQLGELSDLIGDLVHLARDDSSLTLAPLDVRDTVTTAIDRVRRRAQGRDFAIEMEPFFVVANAEALERAVTNLLDNAVKWSPEHGIIRVELAGNRLVVADAGPGIADADLPYVFDRFFRGESASKTHGTGLGLSIVAKVVEEIGGTATAGRAREGGAEFTLQLPGVTNRDAIPHLLLPNATPPDDQPDPASRKTAPPALHLTST